jgi:regulator of protease activity HflC (stomatin/prohibitin superfamily)
MWKTEIVYGWESALLYLNGVYVRQLPPGRHRILTVGRKVEVFRAPNYPAAFPAPLVDVISADRFALRLGATVIARVSDARAAIEGQSQYGHKLILAISESLVTLAAQRTLDDLIADRPAIAEAMLAHLQGKIDELEIESAVISSLVLPPELRRMLTEVERAKMEGAAVLERARGEHAALRTLANAARLLKDNPELMRLRTLQAVSPTGKGATLVLGQDAIAAPKPST